MQSIFNQGTGKLILLLILTGTIFKSCNLVDNNESDFPDWFVIGNSKETSHKIYQSLQVSTRSANSLFVDVDDDGKNDFEFYTESTMSAGLGYEAIMELKCLNESFFVSCNELYDSLYLKTDTSFVNADNLVKVYIWRKITCAKIDEKYKPYAKETIYYPMSYLAGDTLFYNDYFVSDTFKLLYNPPDYPVSMSGVRKNDTITYNSTTRDYCFLFRYSPGIFIGFKKKADKTEYLGWLKISILDDYKLTILESAIQEK
ncbi:MAG TPA: hypothetical protein DER09_07760 [Prolixibacteraceae bacterium]|nr:hypothetical protein [Prolixibacteraceae bacterium]